jgi:hypothetical protein
MNTFLKSINALLRTHGWQKNKFTPELPNVKRYGGGTQLEQAILATEYPDEYELNSDPLGHHLPYTARRQLFSPTEQLLLTALEQALSQQPYKILGKVRLAEVLTIVPGLKPQEQRLAAERINQKHLDFVIYHAHTSAILGVVLLDKPDQDKLDVQMHKKFIAAALAAAQIPILHIPTTKKGYHVEVLRQLLNRALCMRLPKPTPLPTTKALTTKALCPTCGAGLKKVKINKGQYTGRQVWVCTHYPQCKTVFPIAAVTLDSG